MVRLLIVMVVVLLALGGIVVALAGRTGEKPLVHVEKVVTLDDLNRAGAEPR